MRDPRDDKSSHSISFSKKLKTTPGFVEKSKFAAKYVLWATVFDLGG